jgi:hypothetical protein
MPYTVYVYCNVLVHACTLLYTYNLIIGAHYHCIPYLNETRLVNQDI